MSIERLLPMLFSRLSWPSPLARERACTAVARLLSRPEYATAIKAAFLRWLQSQYHESVCGIGLLVLLRAKMDGGGVCPIPVADIQANLRLPSLQSALLLAEYDREAAVQGTLSAWHSGDPPSSFTGQSFFGEFVYNFLPPVYINRATEIEQRMLIPFRRQWEYEWSVVLGRRAFELSLQPLHFWMGYSESDEGCLAVDTPISEIYRSAFLRSLAWAVDTRRMDRATADVAAAQTIPIDLELWSVYPRLRPEWWPIAELSDGPVETAFGKLWASVDDLWRDQESGAAPWGSEWSLACASGRVQSGEKIYDLSVFASFLRPLDSGDPNVDELLEWCKYGDESRLRTIIDSQIRFAGRVPPLRFSGLTRFGDWAVAPATGRFEKSFLPWQWWRSLRGIWGPAVALAQDGYSFRRDGNSIAFESRGQLIARWSDWTEELRERIGPSILPDTGQMLLIRRDLVDQFVAQHQSQFCWLARLTTTYREVHHKPYQTLNDDRLYGASRIILPN